MKNTGIKVLLAVLIVTIALAGYFITTALDRLRESNYHLADTLRNVKTVSIAPAVQESSPRKALKGKASGEALFANKKFFAPEAVTGGRIIRATEAEAGNLNPLTSNEAMASSFNGLCSASLGTRNYAKPELWEPLMAESWEISPDRKSYRIKLRRGILWHDFTDPVTGKKHKDVEVTAKDFKFFVDTVKDPDVNCAPLRVYYQYLDSIEVHNDYEFTVKWRKAYYNSLSSTLGMSPLPRHFYAPDGKFDGKKFNDDHRRNRMIVGCGPMA